MTARDAIAARSENTDTTFRSHLLTPVTRGGRAEGEVDDFMTVRLAHIDEAPEEGGETEGYLS